MKGSIPRCDNEGVSREDNEDMMWVKDMGKLVVILFLMGEIYDVLSLW